jgi:hypothetical protein
MAAKSKEFKKSFEKLNVKKFILVAKKEHRLNDD